MGIENNQHQNSVFDLYIVRKNWKRKIYNISITSKEKNIYYKKQRVKNKGNRNIKKYHRHLSAILNIHTRQNININLFDFNLYYSYNNILYIVT